MLNLLRHWFSDCVHASAQAVPRAGLSGARVWQVTHSDQRYALRQWPPAFSASRLSEIHELQRHLAGQGLPTPAPIESQSGGTLVEFAGANWELDDWRPGAADYHRDARPEKLRAAMHALAHIHLAAAEFVSTAGQGGARIAPAPSLARRQARADALLRGELTELRRAVAQGTAISAGDELARLAPAALTLIKQTLPAISQRLAAWQSTPLPLQWRLGDVHHDHILYTGDQVTGVIDFGAATVDAPAGDVARLLGSLVGDDRAAWREGLAAYEYLRSLSPAERDAVELFDASGTAIAAANWLHWLFVEPPHTVNPLNRPAALDRLRTLTARLRVLAAPPH